MPCIACMGCLLCAIARVLPATVFWSRGGGLMVRALYVQFLLTARRTDAKSVKIKKTGQTTKFKVLSTPSGNDAENAALA